MKNRPMPSRSHNRRQTLRLGSALTLVLAGGRLRTANAKGQILPEGDAYAPWGLWNDPSLRGAPIALVAAAVLAANPHDTQPWLFRISGDAIEVLADLSRNLGAMDAFVREMHLGLGCAIENMLVAAGPNGYDAEVAGVEGSLAKLHRATQSRCGGFSPPEKAGPERAGWFIQRDRPAAHQSLRLRAEQGGTGGLAGIPAPDWRRSGCARHPVRRRRRSARIRCGGR